MKKNSDVLNKSFFFICLFAVSFLMVYIYYPFLKIILLSVLITLTLYPLKKNLDNFFKTYFKNGKLKIFSKKSNNISTSLTLVFFVLATLILLYLFLVPLTEEIINITPSISKAQIVSYYDKFTNHEMLKKYLPQAIEFAKNNDFKTKLADIMSGMFSQFSSIMLKLLQKTGNLFVDYLFALFIIFYLLADGEMIVKRIRSLNPLSANEENHIAGELIKTSKASIVGTGIASALQGFITALPFIFFGWPYLVWAVTMSFLCLLPIIGASLIWIPASIVLFVAHETGKAVFLIIWGIFVGSLENIIREKILNKFSKGAKIHPLFMFFSLLGGVYYFGVAGLVFGPVITSLFISFISIYEKKYGDQLKSLEKQ